MLHVRPKSWLSTDYVVEEDGREIAVLDLSPWRERGTFELDDDSFSLTREGTMSGAFQLEQQGQVVASATKPNFWRSHFEISVDGRDYLLRKRSMLGRDFVLEQSGDAVGTIRPKSFMHRAVDVDLPREWPLEIRLFVVWLVILMWLRESNAAG